MGGPRCAVGWETLGYTAAPNEHIAPGARSSSLCELMSATGADAQRATVANGALVTLHHCLNSETHGYD